MAARRDRARPARRRPDRGARSTRRVDHADGRGARAVAASRSRRRRHRTPVPGREPDQHRARRCLDVRRWAQRTAPAGAAPAGDGRGGRPFRLPRRPVGAPRPDQPLPRPHDVRDGRGGRGRGGRGASRAPPGPRRRARRPPVRGVGPAPRRVGARGRARELPACPPPLRGDPPDPSGRGPLRRPGRRDRPRARGGLRAGDGHRAAGGAEPVPPRARGHPGGPRRRPVPPAGAAAGPTGAGRYVPIAAAAVALLPRWARWPLRLPWLPVTEATVVRAGGEAITRTIRWSLGARP